MLAAPVTAVPIPTNTVVLTVTVLPTSTPVPSPSVSIDGVHVLHKVKGRWVETASVRLKETTRFYLLFHVTNAGSLHAQGDLLLTRHGQPVAAPHASVGTFQGHQALVWQDRFTNKKITGKLYAHFRISLGPALAKRDRKVYLTR